MLLVSVLPFLIVLAAITLAVPATVTTGVVTLLLALDIDGGLAKIIG